MSSAVDHPASRFWNFCSTTFWEIFTTVLDVFRCLFRLRCGSKRQRTSTATSDTCVGESHSSTQHADDAKTSASGVKHKGDNINAGRINNEESRPILCNHSGPTAVTATPTYSIYGVLKRRLSSQNRQVDHISGDGNCFFRAVSKHTFGSEDRHSECRESICDIIDCYPNFFRQYIDQSTVTRHLEDMRKPGTWATTCEIFAAATFLNREIYVFTPVSFKNAEYHWLLFPPFSLLGGAIGGRHGQEGNGGAQPYVTICHTNGHHYDRIIPLNHHCNCQLPPPNLAGKGVTLKPKNTRGKPR